MAIRRSRSGAGLLLTAAAVIGVSVCVRGFVPHGVAPVRSPAAGSRVVNSVDSLRRTGRAMHQAKKGHTGSTKLFDITFEPTQTYSYNDAGKSKSEMPPKPAKAPPRQQGGTVLVSGFMEESDKQDQLIFDILHSQKVWTKINCFCKDAAFARKRLVSRSARYTGLLDKLEFEEGDRNDGKVMTEKLKGCDAWLCFDADKDKLEGLIEAAQTAEVKHVIMTSQMTGEEIDARKDKLSGLKKIKDYTFIRTGKMTDDAPGQAFHISLNPTVKVEDDSIPRDDMVRFAAETLMINNATDRFVSFTMGSELDIAYLDDCRRQGKGIREEYEGMFDGELIPFADEWELRKNSTAEERRQMERNKIQASTKEDIDKWVKESRETPEVDAEKTRERMEKATQDAITFLRRTWHQMSWAGKTTLTEQEFVKVRSNWNYAFTRSWKLVLSEELGENIEDWIFGQPEWFPTDPDALGECYSDDSRALHAVTTANYARKQGEDDDDDDDYEEADELEALLPME